MLGTLATQQLFASANSIAATPNVWAEWNYNAFNPPYLTTSSSGTDVSNSFFNASSVWNVGTDQNGTIAATASGLGAVNISDLTASAVSLTINGRISYETASAAGDIRSNFYSNSINVNGSDKTGKFYKFSFFVKSQNSSYTDGFPSIIKTSDITTTASNTGGSTSTYYYRIVGVNSNGLSLGPDIKNNTDVKLVVMNKNTGAVKLSWNKDSKAAGYRIYRSINNQKSTTYLTTINGLYSTYIDSASNTMYDAYAPSEFSSNVYVVPSVNLYDSSSKLVNGISFIRTIDTASGMLNNDVGSIEAKSDGWTRVELWFGAPSDQPNLKFSNVSLSLNCMSDYENAGILVDNIELYEITEHDYFLHQYFPTESAFKSLLPGESFTNLLLPTSDKSVGSFTQTSVNKPVSFAVKSPRVYVAKEYTTPSIQILPSKTDTFKYYVSDNSYRAIQAQYNTYMSINKIVLKHINTLTTPISGSIILYTGQNNTPSRIQMTSSSFNSNGCTVLYYNGTKWSTTPWTAPPQLSSSATFQNVVNNVRGISFVATGVSITTNPYTNEAIINSSNDSKDISKVHILELSPRLEIDLTPYLLSYSVKKELSSGQSAGFPFSYLNSNSGGIEFSNIPVYSGTNAYSVFENSANNGTFTNLLRQGIKFTCFLSAPSFQKEFNENLPQFTMYSNSWSVNDIDTVSVDLFDYTKNVLQAQESPRFLASNSNLFSIITTMLAAAGISDYDYDNLRNVCSNTSNTSMFWSDETKTIFENLQDLFIVHQIGGYVDEYGILRFKNLGQIYNQISATLFSPTAVITDSTYTLSSITGSPTYISNIIPNSYKENINEKVGVIQVKYQKPTRSYSTLYQNTDIATQSYLLKDVVNKPSAWMEEERNALGFQYLDSSLSISQKYLKFNPGDIYGNRHSLISNGDKKSGIGFIGSEIISFEGLEYSFYSLTNNKIYMTKNVTNQSDINDTVSYILNNNLGATTVGFSPTGRIFGLKRGRYGTEIQDHHRVTADILKNNFTVFTFDGVKTSSSLNWGSSPYATSYVSSPNNGHAQLSVSTKNKYIMLSPNKKSNKYNLFAIDFFVPFHTGGTGAAYTEINLVNAKSNTYNTHKKHKVALEPKPGQTKTKYKWVEDAPIPYTELPNMSVGLFFNKISATNNAGTYYVEISSVQVVGKTQMNYFVSAYRTNANGSKTFFLNNKSVSSRLFDGTMHRLSAYFSGTEMIIAIDNKEIAQVKTGSISSDNNYFGAYLKDDDTQTATIRIQEIYADQVADGNKIPTVQNYQIQSRYFFTTTKYLTDIAKGKQISDNSYLFQAKPRFQGIAYYDAKYRAPIEVDTLELVKVSYGSNEIVGFTNAEENIRGPVVYDDVMYSDVISTPWGFKLLAVNNCEEIVLLHSSDSTSPLQINARQKILTPAETLTRIVNSGFQQSVSLGSQWFNSREDVEKIIQILSKAMDTFYVDIDISIFANPLIQVGDYISLIYTLKGIGYNQNSATTKPIICLVSSVSQGWGQGGEDTSLILKPILS
jgi:hypothetical protein